LCFFLFFAEKLSLISDKFTPYSNEGIVHPPSLEYDRRMKYMMNTKELARLTVIKGAIDGVYTAKRAAGKLGISARRVKHLKKAVRGQGDGAVIHGNAGRHPANVADEGIRKKILVLKKSDTCRKANFTRFRELPEERERIKISYSSLPCLLKGAGISFPKTRRSAGERRTMRERKPRCGELVQTDASPFDWLGQGLHYALRGFQDDATRDIPGCICASASVSRGVSRRFGRFYRAVEYHRPCTPAGSGYISSTPKDRRTGRLRNNWQGKPWIKPNAALSWNY
jgi:transposase